MAKLKAILRTVLPPLAGLALAAAYWYWINQRLITDTQVGLVALFLLSCATTLYIPIPINLIILGTVTKYDPAIVAVIAGFGTIFAYYSEYLLVTFAFKFERIARLKNNWLYKKATPWFDRHAFVILTVASFLPLSAEPLRAFAITREYSKTGYIVAGFLGRVPRHFLLGYFGRDYVHSLWFIIGVIVFPIIPLVFAKLVSVLKRKEWSKDALPKDSPLAAARPDAASLE